jgi:hypothetical protein
MSVLSREVLVADCRSRDPRFSSLAHSTAVRRGVDPRLLTVRTLLHLPRVATRRGEVTWRQVRAELGRSAVELQADEHKVGELVPTAAVELRDLEFRACPDDVATKIFTHLHYLRSGRPDSLNLALFDPVSHQPLSLCSVSPMQWKPVARQIARQFGVAPAAVWDVSRVYSFDLAPPNAISYLLSRARNEIRKVAPEVQLLMTAVDPNLGFHGSSYGAANWHCWMTIGPRPYLYFDGRYVSPRQLRSRFQTANPVELRSEFGNRFQQSRMPLLDSMIFCCRITGRTEPVPVAMRRRVRR